MKPEPTEMRLTIAVRIAVRAVRAEEAAQDVGDVLFVIGVLRVVGFGVARVRGLYVDHGRRVVFDQLREVRQIGVAPKP